MAKINQLYFFFFCTLFYFPAKSSPIDSANTRIKQDWFEPDKTSFLRIILKRKKTNSRGRNYALEKDRAMTAFRVSHCFQQASFVTGRSTTNFRGYNIAKMFVRRIKPKRTVTVVEILIEDSLNHNLFSLRIISYHYNNIW